MHAACGHAQETIPHFHSHLVCSRCLTLDHSGTVSGLLPVQIWNYGVLGNHFSAQCWKFPKLVCVLSVWQQQPLSPELRIPRSAEPISCATLNDRVVDGRGYCLCLASAGRRTRVCLFDCHVGANWARLSPAQETLHPRPITLARRVVCS